MASNQERVWWEGRMAARNLFDCGMDDAEAYNRGLLCAFVGAERLYDACYVQRPAFARMVDSCASERFGAFVRMPQRDRAALVEALMTRGSELWHALCARDAVGGSFSSLTI